ncbi:hypothetical protein DKP78_25820, partial [Enterococcus faecium]
MPPPGLSTLEHSALEEHATNQSSSSSPEPLLPVQLLQLPPPPPPPQLAPQPTIIISTPEHNEVQTEDLSYAPDLQA